jgi:5,10-methenyltetrahydrofolate synthetase
MGPAEPSGDHAGDSVPFRERLRRDRIAARLAMTDDEYQRASAQIAALLKSVLAARRPQAIGFCWPVRREFDARPLVSELIDGGWRACQPVVVTPAAPMQFRGWTPDAPMTTDRHGIPIPDTSRCTAPDVLLLPLVAFDGEGYRIGYGGHAAAAAADDRRRLRTGPDRNDPAAGARHPPRHDRHRGRHLDIRQRGRRRRRVLRYTHWTSSRSSGAET